jgi:cell division protein FtsL
VPVADRRLTVKGNHIFSGVVQLTTDWHRLILKKNSEVTALVHIDKVGIGNVF